MTHGEATGGKNESGAPGPRLGDKFERLAGIMEKLRSPDGCPWDLEQTPESLSRHLLEEAYESVEAIDTGDWGHLEEELGDLLLQVVFQSQIAEEAGRFDLSGVVDGIAEKLVRRHPHIFGEVRVDSAEQVSLNWDRIKREEKGGDGGCSLRVPSGLPAMMAALKVQGQAARAGFDWPSPDGVFAKLAEESRELWDVRDGPVEEKEKELGDLLFTAVNLARHIGVDPERALRMTCARFAGRYSLMEEEAGRRGVDLGSLSLEEMDELWEGVKAAGGNETLKGE